MLHSVLLRQLAKYGADPERPPDASAWARFLERVSQAYVDADQERYRIERSLAILSEEMHELNERLAAERNRLEAMIGSMGDALCVTDAEGEISFVNPEAARLLGHAGEALLGMPVLSIVAPGQSGALEHALRSHLAFRSDAVRLMSATGEPIDVAIAATPLSHQASGAVLIFRDVGDRKRAEEALRASESRFRAIFASAALGIVVVSVEGAIQESNDAYCEMLGRSRQELRGKSVVDLINPDDAASLRDNLAAVRTTSRPGAEIERRYVHASGATVWVLESASIVRDARGEPLFGIRIIQDITERKRLEGRLRHAQKLESVGLLAAGVAHEINTPIQFIGDNISFFQSAFESILKLYDALRAMARDVEGPGLAAVEALEADADLEYLLGEIPKAITQTLEGTSHVAKIVQAMKVFSHRGSGDEPSSVDLRAAIQSTITVASNETKYVADVIADLGDVPQIIAHASDLNQVFLNLLVNAAHAVADVVAKTGERGTIKIATRLDGDHAIVTFEDTGTGIPDAIKDRIFDPFFTTKDVGQGTGQGLSLARTIVVDKHGGSLSFESTVGIGSVFRVSLPLHGRAGSEKRSAA